MASDSEQSRATEHALGHVQEHIDLIARHESEFLAKRTAFERLGDRLAAFIGSLGYVALHLVLAAGWVGWNSLPKLPHFDPLPYPLLDLFLALEAILVASFILMRQSRLSRRSDERDHLMLQILLLTEREITANLGMQRQMAHRLGLHKLASDEAIAELSEKTSIDEVAQIIQESLPAE
jgi:uncharacterized membrane protein